MRPGALLWIAVFAGGGGCKEEPARPHADAGLAPGGATSSVLKPGQKQALASIVDGRADDGCINSIRIGSRDFTTDAAGHAQIDAAMKGHARGARLLLTYRPTDRTDSLSCGRARQQVPLLELDSVTVVP